MKQKRVILIVLLLIATVGLLSSLAVLKWKQSVSTSAGTPDATYAESCGSCHIAYPPQLLPIRSWVWLLANPQQHFGTALSLPETRRQALLRYLVSGSAEAARTPLAHDILASLTASSDMPLRIADVPYIAERHQNITSEKGSLSACADCHPGAERGAFDLRP